MEWCEHGSEYIMDDSTSKRLGHTLDVFTYFIIFILKPTNACP